MPKALIVGASGQLGVELVRELRQRGSEVTGYDRVHLDITDLAAVERAVADCVPDVIFNCAAYNQVDVAEKDPHTAVAVNGLGVRNLALASRQWDARLVHFSTDYVFDGAAGRPYVETDATHPLSAYAVSKLTGELYAQAYLENALVIRTSGVFGPAGRHTRRGNFVELMLRLAHENKPIRVVEDHVASPTFAPLLASRTLDLLERRESGIFHIGGGTAISWFRYAQLIFSVAGLQPELHATSEREYRTPARRPRYSALKNARLEALGIEAMPPLAQAVADYFAARD